MVHQSAVPVMGVAVGLVAIVWLAGSLGLILWGIASRNRAWIPGVLGLVLFAVAGMSISYIRLERSDPATIISMGDARSGETPVRLEEGPALSVRAPGISVALDGRQAPESTRDWKATEGILQLQETQRKAWASDSNLYGTVLRQMGPLRLELATPDASGRIVGRSSWNEPSAEDADRSARQSVKTLVRDLILAALLRKRDLSDAESARAIEEASQVAADLIDKGAIDDRYAASGRLPQSGEPIYRAAVLARLPEGGRWIDEKASQVDARLQGRQKAVVKERVRFGGTIFSAGALALVVYLLYAFLNAGTKGHMAWPLRIVSLAAFLLLCLALLAVRGHLP